MRFDELPDLPDGALNVQSGVERPPSINASYRATFGSAKKKSPKDLADSLLAGDRLALSAAITLIESTREADRERARQVVDLCLPRAGGSIRVGITGVPGVGKSSLIETLGLQVVERHRLAVLAIDPSSQVSGGSILGDKSRMFHLANHPSAFVRPSPSRGSLGGVARKTREAILLCEAAGYDLVFIETVGVGQSEAVVHSMVDCFLLLLLAGAGDELQGIKRGIMEMADVLTFTKVDGENQMRAKVARQEFENALRFFPAKPSGWRPPVLTCSSKSGEGVPELWESIERYIGHERMSGWLDERRRKQALQWMRSTIEDALLDEFHSSPAVESAIDDLTEQVQQQQISPYRAAQALLAAFREEGQR